MTTKHNTELNDMELTQVSGGADGDDEFSIAKLLEEYDFDPTKDPFYFPGPYLPWDPKQYMLPGYDPCRMIEPDMQKDA